MCHRIVAEGYGLVRADSEGDVGAIRYTTLAIILIPGFVVSHFGFVVASRDVGGGKGIEAITICILQPGAQAVRLPVTRTAQGSLKVSWYRSDNGVQVICDPMAFMIVEKFNIYVYAQTKRDIGSIRFSVSPIILVPAVV